jgi:prolyl oligopeptidase
MNFAPRRNAPQTSAERNTTIAGAIGLLPQGRHCTMRERDTYRRPARSDRLPCPPQTDSASNCFDISCRSRLEDEEDTVRLDAASHMRGLHVRIYDAIGKMPARTTKDYEHIVARLEGVPAYLNGGMQFLQESIDRRIVQPRVVIDAVGAQLELETKQDARETPLLAALREFPSTVPDDERQRLIQRGETAYREHVIPALQKFRTFLASTYAPRARPEVAVSAIPDGARIYASLVRRHTTTQMTPIDVHDLGIQEVARIERAMQTILDETGFKGSIQDFEAMLRTKPGMLFLNQEEMLLFARNVAMMVQPQLPFLFKRLPRIPFGIRPVPPDREAAGTTYYDRPAADGTRAGWVSLNTHRANTQVKYPQVALILHEGIPGHHLQLALILEMDGIPEFRKYLTSTANTEGWGLYAESLGEELGVYRDPYTRFGRLTSERYRAVRLVVDTGLHAFGWSREKAIEYFRLHAPTTPVGQIDRYIATPGQALAYKIGELKIIELRKNAERTLGQRFDIREFHDVVLANGILPLEILERQVNNYIQKNTPSVSQQN